MNIHPTVVAIVAGTLLLPAAPGMAQLDPPMVAQGQVLSGMNQGYADRNRGRSRPRASGRTAATCANNAKQMARRGDADARVRRLRRLCREAGY